MIILIVCNGKGTICVAVCMYCTWMYFPYTKGWSGRLEDDLHGAHTHSLSTLTLSHCTKRGDWRTGEENQHEQQKCV